MKVKAKNLNHIGNLVRRGDIGELTVCPTNRTTREFARIFGLDVILLDYVLLVDTEEKLLGEIGPFSEEGVFDILSRKGFEGDLARDLIRFYQEREYSLTPYTHLRVKRNGMGYRFQKVSVVF